MFLFTTEVPVELEQDVLHCYISSVVVFLEKWDELMKLALVITNECIIDCNCSKPIVFFANFCAKIKYIYLLTAHVWC